MIAAVLGYGTVGRNVCSILQNKNTGISLKYILEIPEKATQPLMVSDIHTILNDPEVEIVVDALPAVHPSYEFIKAALEHGKHVVSSNKAALCHGFRELTQLAVEKNLALRFEAACGGTIPNLCTAAELGTTQEIDLVYGIMNGTTNYILDSMTRGGMGFDEALQQARALGYAEADPTADISGYDVRNKIVIMASIAFKGYVDKNLPSLGIGGITKSDIEYFMGLGKTIKLLGMAVRRENRYALGVAPCAISDNAQEAHVPLNFNMISIDGEHAGVIKLYGQGAGGLPTADAIVRDMLTICAGTQQSRISRYDRELIYDPSLLAGRARINGLWKEGTLAELAAAQEDASFVFEPSGDRWP